LPISAQAIASKRNYRLQLLSPTTGEPVFYRSEDPRHQAACMVCRECGGSLQFEFQVLPQLLYYLGVDRHTKIVRPQENPQLTDTATSIDNTSTSNAGPTEFFHNSSEEVKLTLKFYAIQVFPTNFPLFFSRILILEQWIYIHARRAAAVAGA